MDCHRREWIITYSMILLIAIFKIIPVDAKANESYKHESWKFDIKGKVAGGKVRYDNDGNVSVLGFEYEKVELKVLDAPISKYTLSKHINGRYLIEIPPFPPEGITNSKIPIKSKPKDPSTWIIPRQKQKMKSAIIGTRTIVTCKFQNFDPSYSVQ